MWICLNDGFLSIVKGGPHKGQLLVRARKRSHLAAFLGPSNAEAITYTPERDYHWRAYMPASLIADLLRRRLRDLSYDNFKDSVSENALHNMYAAWWSNHLRYQQTEHP
jgi:hypothetical protein